MKVQNTKKRYSIRKNIDQGFPFWWRAQEGGGQGGLPPSLKKNDQIRPSNVLKMAHKSLWKSVIKNSHNTGP